MRQLQTSDTTPRRGGPAREASKKPGVTDGYKILDIMHYTSQRARVVAGEDQKGPVRHIPPEWVCQFELDGHYYNLSPLFEAGKMLNASFVLEDVKGGHWDSAETRYNYYVGFCQDIHDVPELCREGRKATPGGKDGTEALRDPDAAAVYQVSTGDNPNCHRLGGVSSSWSFGFLDHRRPSQGIRLTYETGDVCMKRVTSYDKSKGTQIEVRSPCHSLPQRVSLSFGPRHLGTE